MSTEKIAIHEMITRMELEARRLGFSETFIWRDFIPRLRKFAVYYDRHGYIWYDPAITQQVVDEHEKRYEKGALGANALSCVKTYARRLNEFYLSETFHIHMPRRGTQYKISPDNEHLIYEFIAWKKYGPNTRDDVVWVLRRYFCYFESKGIFNVEDVTLDMVRDFISDTAAAVKPASLHNIMLYLRYFYRFLKTTDLNAPDAEGLFSYKVYRDYPIQSYVTDEELERILAVIDTETESGKRNRAIILLAANTGLRACDIAQLKLRDIDWRRGCIQIAQKKTNEMVYIPLTEDVGEALQDYILNARPHMDCQEVFLRISPPKIGISDPVCIGSMFIAYQKKAGIERKAFDGKAFMGFAVV